MPLHPLIVHIPLVLAGLVPIVAAYLARETWLGRGSRRAWLVPLALQVVIVATVLIAIDTGGDEAGVVRAVVPRDAIHDHAGAAHWFEYATIATLAILAAAAWLRDRRAAIAGFVATAVALVTVVIGIRVGHLGGKLVFEHDAPAAYRAK
ncbi:MAG TPA: DUF2231 domain-containing protein [Kofleriaceae bacterium]|nr:DUF2231 domain-containing protein [Kofleriaceae bacterium]